MNLLTIRFRARCACSRAVRVLHIIAADYFFRWPPQLIFSSFGRQGALACRPIGGQVKRLGLRFALLRRCVPARPCWPLKNGKGLWTLGARSSGIARG